MKRLLYLIPLMFAIAFAGLPAEAGQPKKAVHGRGHKPVPAAVSLDRHKVSDARYAKRLAALPVATQPTYDLRTLGLTPAVLDQGQCGDCYMFSGTRVAAGAFLKAGLVTLATTPGWQFSPQYGLDCHPELGGCDGGDEWQVTQLCLSPGWYSSAQYPGAGQQSGRCQSVTGAPYVITGMGFCNVGAGANSVAPVQDVKNAMLAYGVISVAVAAGSGDWDNCPASGVLNGPGIGDTSIDHAVTLAGWYDNGKALPVFLPQSSTGGWWIVQNQWGTSWGAGGFAYIPYGGYSIATEAYWATAGALPPPGPNPVPPVVPPTPPAPCFHPLRPWLCQPGVTHREFVFPRLHPFR